MQGEDSKVAFRQVRANDLTRKSRRDEQQYLVNTSAKLMEEWKMQEFIPVEIFFQCAEFMDPTRWACCCFRDKDWMVEQTV